MKKSTRVLALLLCLVMVVAIMPAFTIGAKADDSSAVRYQNDEIKNQTILRYEKEYYSEHGGFMDHEDYFINSTVQRHSVEAWNQIEKVSGNVLDRGYKDSNIFLFPQGNGTVSFAIQREQVDDYRGANGTTDENRWWRWGSWQNGMKATTRAWLDDYAFDVVKSNSQESHLLLIPRGYHTVYQWTGGTVDASKIVDVKIDSNLDVGTSAQLWSANGTNVSNDWVQGKQLRSHETAWVVAGDISKHTFTIAKSTSVVYYLNGGSYTGKGGDPTAPVGFYCWSTNDAATSELHDIMEAPTRDGYTFLGWECVEDGGNPNLKVGKIYQPFDKSLYNETVASSGKTIHSHSLDGKGSCIAVTDNIKFKAVWEKKDFTIKHIQNGTEVASQTVNMATLGKYEYVAYNEPLKFVMNENSYDITSKVTPGKLYGGTFTDAACTTPATAANIYNGGSAMAFTPKGGATYYIWEVTDEHLVPKNLSVWSKTGKTYDVNAVYLLTAIDRLNYSKAGFKVTAGAANDVPDKEGNYASDLAYSYITLWNNEQDKTYFSLYPAATTTENSLIQCCALEGFTEQDITVVPYWVTLDGVKVFGTTQRTIHYKGSGTSTDYQSVLVTDARYNGARIVADNAVMSAAPAPLMLMARYSMANEENFVDVGNLPDAPDAPEEPDVPGEPETAAVNVVDGDKAYEAEIVDGAVALTPAGADGKLFAGWFVDAAFTAPADLAAVSDGDTVYAKYVSAGFLQMKYAAVFTLFNKTVSLTAAVADKNFAETGFVIETKNGTETVAVSSYAAKFALQNAQQLFGVAKNAPLMTVDYKLSGLSKGDTVTVTPYWVTADGTTVYGTARTLTYTGLTVKG